VNRIGRRTVMAMLLIMVLAILWNCLPLKVGMTKLGGMPTTSLKPKPDFVANWQLL